MVYFESIDAAQTPSLYFTTGNATSASGTDVSIVNIQYHQNAPMFNEMSARCLHHSVPQQPRQLIYSQAPAIQILKTQAYQVKVATSQLEVGNNIKLYTNYINTLPKALLHQSVGYLQQGAISGKTISSFRYINNELSVHFDKPLPVLRSELASANSLKNSIFQEFLQNGFTTDAKFVSFAKAEMLVDQLQFVVKVKEECLTHALAQLQPYENALKLAVENPQLCLPNSAEYKLLEQQESLLKSSMQQDQALFAKHEIMLKGLEKELASLDHFYNVFERDALKDVQKSKIAALEIMQQAKTRIVACNTELSRLRPILANVKQANVEQTMAANTLSVNTIAEPVTTAITDVKQEVISNTPSQLQSDKDVMLSTEYRVNPETAVSLQALDYDVNKEFIVEFKGNHVQHYVHNKLKESLVKIGSVKQTTVEVKELLKSAINFNKIGQTLNIHHKTNDALAAQNTSDKIADYAAALADAGLAIGEGVLEGTKSTAHFIVDTIDLATLDPQAIERVKISFDAASQAASQFMAKLDSWLDLKLTPGQENRARQIRNDYLESLWKSIAAKIANTPARDQIKAIAQFATEWVLLGKVGGVFGSAAHMGQVTTEQKILNPLKSLVCEVAEATAKTLETKPMKIVANKVETNLAKTVKNNECLNNGISEFANESKKLSIPKVQSFINEEEAITSSIQTSLTGPEPLTSLREHGIGFKSLLDTSGKAIGKADNLPIKCPTSKKLYHHFANAKSNGRILTGGHMPHKQPGLIDKVLRGPNEYGIREVKLRKGNIGSYRKTIVPSHWNLLDYVRHLREAYDNIVGKETMREGVLKLIGVDKMGIKWEMYLELNQDSYKLVTGYPKYE